METKHIVILVHHYSTLFNISAPIEVFQHAMEQMEKEHKRPFSYQIHIVSAHAQKTIVTKPGITINCEHTYPEINYQIDTLIVIGAPRKNGFEKDVLTWLEQQAGVVRRICAMCAGAFILAEAGILNQKKAVTHWQLCDEMANTFPGIDVDREAIFIRDGNVYTSAGVSAGLDLSLALIEEDLGRDFALKIAKLMVLFLKRPGNQTQFSTILESQKTDYQPIKEITNWIYNHLNEDITVEKLATLAFMSPRNFARAFVRELNTTPIKFVEKLRTETACRLLTDSQLNIDEIAHFSGFKTSLNMNRIFLKTYQISPSHYRRNFSSAFSAPNKY